MKAHLLPTLRFEPIDLGRRQIVGPGAESRHWPQMAKRVGAGLHPQLFPTSSRSSNIAASLAPFCAMRNTSMFALCEFSIVQSIAKFRSNNFLSVSRARQG